jgi:hypothetical protein
MMFISRSGLIEHYPASYSDENKAYADKFCQPLPAFGDAAGRG